MTYDDLIIFVNINFNIKLYIFKIKFFLLTMLVQNALIKDINQSFRIYWSWLFDDS